MKKKHLALLLALVMLAGLLSACAETGSGASASSAATSASSAAAQSTAAQTTAAQTAVSAPANAWDPVPSETKENFNKSGYPIVNEPITVTAVFEHNTAAGYGDPAEMSYWQTMEDLTNIHIEWTMFPGTDITSEVELFFAAGDFPDFLHSYITQDRIQTYGVEGGMFYNYADLIDEYMPNMVSWFEEFPEAKKIITQLDGAIYSLPRIQKASTSARGQMFYRTDYLDKLGLAAPATIDEFHDALKAIKEADLTQGYAPLLPYSVAHLNSQMEPFLFAAFGDSTEPDFADDGSGTVVYNRTSDQYKRYIEYMSTLYAEGLLENEMFTLDTAVTLSRAKEGKAAFVSNGSNILEDSFADGQIHLDCLAPLTSEYTSEQKVQAYDYVSTIGGAINADCKYVEELLRMFDMNYSREEVVPGSGFDSMSQNLGIYGKDWEWQNDEHTAYQLIVPSDWTQSPWVYKSTHGSWAQFYSAFICMGTSSTAGNNLARENGMMKNNIPYAVSRFPDTTMKYTADETQAVTNKLTDIKSYVEQMRAKFITGIEPLSGWDAYVEQIGKMGINDVLAIKQAAYDRWNAS